MKHTIFAIFGIGIGMALLLASVYVLWQATEFVTQITYPLLRVLAIGGELLVGIFLLLASLWVATHLMVRLLAPAPDARQTA